MIEKLKLFSIFILIISTLSCRGYISPRAISHLYLESNLSATQVYVVIGEYAQSLGLEKYDRNNEPAINQKLTVKDKKRHFVSFIRKNNSVSIGLADYSDNGYVQINVYESNPEGFTKKGAGMFKDINNFIRKSFPTNKLTIERDAIISTKN